MTFVPRFLGALLALWLAASPAQAVILLPLPGCGDEVTGLALVTLLRDLIQARSVNGVHLEEKAQAVLETFAVSNGIRVRKAVGATGRPVVLFSVGPENEAGLLLVAHIDTVGEGELPWIYPPFAGVVADGKMYGRGAIDNKGGAVAGMAALLKAKKAGVPLSLACVPDEEAGATGELGINLLAKQGMLKGFTGAIYTYPGLDKLILGHRGVWRFKVTVSGEGRHAGSSGWQESQAAGTNALLGVSEVSLKLEALSLELNKQKGDGLFARHATVVTPTVSAAGQSYGQVPDQAVLKVDVRLIPQIKLDGLRPRIAAILKEVNQRRPGLKFDMQEEYFIPSTEIASDLPLVAAAQAAAKVHLGAVLPLQVSGPANESYLLNRFSIPTMVLGPQGAGAHGKDEYVVLDSIPLAAAIYFDIAVSVRPK